MLLFLFLLHHVEATEIQKQPITKHVTECPAVGYFFKREFVEENKVCYLCFCKEDDMAICFPRDNKRCDVESFHFHGIGKREQRLRRSPSLTEIFSRDSARDVLQKQSPGTCKPHEGSKSEGCPPADWCTGCMVCDCNSKGQWDCHILRFCPDDEKQAMQKKREVIKNFGKRRKAKHAPKKEQEKIFRSTKQIFTANGKKNSVKSNKVQTKNFQQASKKNSNLNMKKKLAPQRRSPQIIKQSQNQNKKKDNRYVALSTGKSRQKKMVVSPKKNNNQKAKVVKSALVRNSSKKLQVRRTPNQSSRKVVKPNRKTVHNRPPVKAHRKPQTKPQPSKRSLLPRRNQKKDPKRMTRLNTTQLTSTTAIPMFNTLKEQLQQELNKKILEVVEKLSKHSVPLKTENKKKVKRSAVLVEQLKVPEPSVLDNEKYKNLLSIPFRKFYKINMQKSNKLGKRRPKRTGQDTSRKILQAIRKTIKKLQAKLNVKNKSLALNKENKKREKRSPTFVKQLKVSEPSILDISDKYMQTYNKLGKGRPKRISDRIRKIVRQSVINSLTKLNITNISLLLNKENKKREKRSPKFVKQLKVSEPSILDISDKYMQTYNKLGKRRPKRKSDRIRKILRQSVINSLTKLNITNISLLLNKENKKREKRSPTFVKQLKVSEPRILDVSDKYMQTYNKLGKGSSKRKSDIILHILRQAAIDSLVKLNITNISLALLNTQNRMRVKRSAKFVKSLEISKPSILDGGNEYKNFVSKLFSKTSDTQKFKMLNLRNQKRNNRSRDLDSLRSAIGMIDVENASLPVHTLSSTKYLITTKKQRYPFDDVNKKLSKDFANATLNNKNFKRSVSVTKLDRDLTILKLSNRTKNLFGGQKYKIKSLDENKNVLHVAETVTNPTTKAVSSAYYEFLRKKGDIKKRVAEATIYKYIEHNDTLRNTKNNENKTTSYNTQDSKHNDSIEKERHKNKTTKPTTTASTDARTSGTTDFPVTDTEKNRKTSFTETIPSFNYFYATDKDSQKVTDIANITSTTKGEIMLSIIDVTKNKNVYTVADLHTSKVNTQLLMESTTIKEDGSTIEMYKNPLLFSNTSGNAKSPNWSYKIIEDIDNLNNIQEESYSKPSYFIKQSTEGYFVLKSNDSEIENIVANLEQNTTEQELIVKPLTSKTAEAWPQTKKLESDADTLINRDTIYKHNKKSTKNKPEEYNKNNHKNGQDNFTIEELSKELSKRTPTMPSNKDYFLKEPTERSTTDSEINFIVTTPKISYITIGDNIVIVKEKNGEKDLHNYTKAAYTIDVVTQLPDLYSNFNKIPYNTPEVVLSLENKNKIKGNKTQENSGTTINATDENKIDVKQQNNKIISYIQEKGTGKHLENKKATYFDVVDITQNSINSYIDDKASKIREQRFSTIHNLKTTTDKSVNKVLYSQYFTPKVPFRRRYDIKKIHTSSKKHKLTKIVSTPYNKSWKDEIFQIQPIQLSHNQTNKTDNKSKVHDLKNFFYKIVNNLARHSSNERKNAKAKKFKVVKYLQKFFKKMFSNGNKQNNELTPKLSQKNILRSLCTIFGPCDINNENKAKLHQMIDLLNKEAYEMLKTIKIIKGLLRVVDFGKNNTNHTYKSRKMKFKSDVQKLHKILQNFYNGHPALNNLSDTQRVQVSHIKNSTQDFVQSAARFTMILNNIIYLVTPKNASLLQSVKQKKYIDLKMELDLRQRASERTSLVNKLRELISKYSLMQNTFMRKMMRVLSTVDGKSVAKRTIETPKSGKNNETYQVYLQKVINNLRKLKTLADTEAHGRHKRELRDDDSVEYLLMLMEYLLKQNRAEVAPVNDGIDLLIEAIKSAPAIKPIEKNIVAYPVNRSRLKVTTTPYVTTTTSTPITPKPATMKIIINSDSASDNSLPDNLPFNNISMKSDDFKLNYVEDMYDNPYANLAKNYKYQNGYFPEEEKQKRRLNVQQKNRKPKIQDIENDVQKLEYGTEITLNKNHEEVIKKFAYESPFQKLKENVEKLSLNPPAHDIKSDVAKLEANLQVLQKDFQSLQSYTVDQDVTPAVKDQLLEEDKPVIEIDEISSTTPPPVTTEIQLDIILPVTENNVLVQYNASNSGGDEERAETFITEVEDEVLSPNFQFLKASTSPPVDRTITLSPVSIKVLNNNEDVSMSLSKSKLNWIDEAYVDDNKADISTELRAAIKSELNQSTKKSPSYIVGHLVETEVMTTEPQKDVKKNVGLNGLSKEIQRGHATEKSGFTEEVLRRKNIDLLNSLDYGTEKGDTDISGSKESNAEDKYSGDTFSWYFDK